MYLEASTGKDSFRAQGASQKRNVQVNTWVRVENNGEGKKIVPIFEAFQKKLKFFRETSLVQTIPRHNGAWAEHRGVLVRQSS